MNTVKVKVYNKSNNPLPTYATSGSAGMDVRADLSEEDSKDWIVINPHSRYLIKTGLHVELPAGYFMALYPRSGMSLKLGLSNANSVGVIDSDYRGDIGIIALNTSNEPIVIHHGDRVGQIILQEYSICEFVEVKNLDELDATERGDGGYGHTGVK